MAQVKIDIPEPVEQEIRQLFRGMALEIIQEVRAADTQMKPYMTKSEACEAVGVAFSTMQRWIKAGKLREIKIDGKILISRETLINFLKDHEA